MSLDLEEALNKLIIKSDEKTRKNLNQYQLKKSLNMQNQKNLKFLKEKLKLQMINGKR